MKEERFGPGADLTSPVESKTPCPIPMLEELPLNIARAVSGQLRVMLLTTIPPPFKEFSI
jgi:hypothetical protein